MILQLGDPRLRTRSKYITFGNRTLAESDIERMWGAFYGFRSEYGFGRAMAAPQIGIDLRAIVLDVPNFPRLLINPELRAESDDVMTLWDDCMCFPQLLVRVQRATSVALSYCDVDGRECVMPALPPVLSELLQHEVDHLDGILAIDRAAEKDDIISRSAFVENRDYFLSRVTQRY